MKLSHLTFAVLLAGTAGISRATPVASSSFNTGLEGWTTSPGDQWQLTWSSSGGNSGGFAKGTDAPGYPSFYYAPSAYLGNWNALEGGSLAWDHNTLFFGPAPTPFSITPLVQISGAGGTAIAYGDVSATVQGQWTHFSIPIEAYAWTVTSGTWAGLLANVTSLQIGGEYIGNSSPSGAELWGMDNVRLNSAPEPTGIALLATGLLALNLRCTTNRRQRPPGRLQ